MFFFFMDSYSDFNRIHLLTLVLKFILGSSKAFAQRRSLAFEGTVNTQINDLRDDLERQIDEALAGLQTALDGKCQLKRGNFNGNGGSSRLVITGPTPHAVILSNGSTVVTVIDDDSTIGSVRIIANGFEVYSGSPNMNQSGKRYNYVALI